jgi:DNA primase
LSATLLPAKFNVRTVPERLRTMSQDPWNGFFDIRQAITKAMQAQIEPW